MIIMNVYVDIENVKDESPVDINRIHKSAEEFLMKIGHIADIEFLKFHVKKYKKTGTRAKYSVHTQLVSSIGLFESKSWGWELVTSAQNALNKLEKEFIKKLNAYFTTTVEVPRIMIGRRQELETLINEEALLFAKYLRKEREVWIPRIMLT